MQIKSKNPDVTLALTEFFAELSGHFKTDLGRDACERYCSCKENRPLWPIRFGLKAVGIVDSEKEGRLRVSVTGEYALENDEKPKNLNGFRVDLAREATGQPLGGHVVHEEISRIVRENEGMLIKPAHKALLKAILDVQTDEDLKSSAHAARARTAKMAYAKVKQQM